MSLIDKRLLIAGNWKMNLNRKQAEALVRSILSKPVTNSNVETAIFPPFPLLWPLRDLRDILSRTEQLKLGGQDCHHVTNGAHTGDIAASMLRDAGCYYVILGHSERRTNHSEGDFLVKAKAEAALAAGLQPVICVGESLSQRKKGQAVEIVAAQLRASLPEVPDQLILAYEPVWAIGTGQTARLEDIDHMHHAIRECLTARFGTAGEAIKILYGGSVKPDNAAPILALTEVGGALVGGASLQADDFMTIVESAPKI